MSESTEDLIREFRESSQKLKSISRYLTLGIVGVILIFLVLILSSFRNFAKHGVPQLVGALEGHASPLVQKYAPSISSAINNALPAFANSFHKTLEGDLPKIEEQMSAEAERLEKYLEGKWPEYEQQIQKLILEQEDVLRKEFSGTLSEDKVEDLALAYGHALSQKYHKILHKDMNQHVDTADKIAQNLQKIGDQEKTEDPVNLQEALGLFLELAGLEMQSGIEKAKSKK